MAGDDDEKQLDHFRRAAREAGADESEDHFKARLRKIAKAKASGPTPTKDDDDGKSNRG